MSTPSASHPAPGQSCRVLHAEDNPRDAMLCSRQLEQAGFILTTDVVATPEEFADALSSKSYDVVLSDYNLPGWSGAEALEMVRRNDGEIPFILVTGTVGEETAVEFIKKGATDFVFKDRPARLPLVLERALQERRLREDRRQSEQIRDLLAAIVESSDDAIIGQALDGTIVSWNRGAERLYGYSAGEVQGRSTSLLFRGSAEELDPIMGALQAGGAVERYETKGAKKDGATVDVAVTISPIRHPDGYITGVSLIARDLTENKRLQQEFFVAQKMEAVGRLAAGVAHDFNNLLTVIAGYSSLILMDLKEEDPSYEPVQEISKAGERAGSLTRQLLAFCRKQALAPQPLDLNIIVADMDHMLRRVIRADVELVTILHPELGSIRADPGQIEQVIMNLAVNARDAMANGGKLTLETANVELEPAHDGRHTEISTGPSVMLAMTDTGTGMDTATQSRIFEPFFTTKAEGEGTGLGLATVFGIVKQGGGSILVDSELGHGTTFKIYFPRVPEEAVSRQADSRPNLSGGAETVLLVDDEDAIRGLVCRVLRKLGHTVLEAKNGSEALLLCEQHRGRIDLLISDMVMPSMSGCELIERLIPSRPELKVLLMSGYTDASIRRNAVVPSDTAFLAKPFVTAALARKVREVLDGR